MKKYKCSSDIDWGLNTALAISLTKDKQFKSSESVF